MLDQLQVELAVPAKISISRAANISNWSNNRECHRPVRPVPVKVSINQAASGINVSSSRECRHLVKKAALLPDPKAVLTAKAAANTKPKA